MDPLSLAIAAALAAGVATGAGESAGAALPALVRRIRERFAGRPIDIPTDAESREQLSAALDEEFTRDPAFRQECQALWSQVTNGGAANSFQGQAKNVVMTRDIHGGFTIQ
ncbi:hypothetical protein OG429_06095 [Streptomyces sp. NBC_00190]|uniref:hypothetical protein n=1 Tax=unclassified Streptomyces TaxID=2593676 RepID=UPI002E2DF7F6|nr:hypothetical protein [Streptomyces sp. NBC_00190]WSZ38940.1 hypothetical protein OG239_09105 [Streptomyces sp. NBC_00868]